MLRNSTIVLALALALTLVVGCNGADDIVSGGGGSGDSGTTLASQMADVALQSDLVTEQILNSEFTAMGLVASSTTGEGGGSGTVTQDITFSRSRSCPLGGDVSVQGTIHRTWNEETRVMEAEASGSRTRNECTFARDELTITVNGSASWDASRRRVDGVPDGLQTTHYYGSWHAARSDGEERSCDFEITIVRDPSTQTRTVDGTICGTEVHRSVTWSHDE